MVCFAVRLVVVALFFSDGRAALLLCRLVGAVFAEDDVVISGVTLLFLLSDVALDLLVLFLTSDKLM